MKILSNNLILLALSAVLSIFPLQVFAVSVSDCFDTNKNMHHLMDMSHQGNHKQMTHTGTQKGCCGTIVCDMTHCAGFVAIATKTIKQNDLAYTLSEVHVLPTEALLPFYPSSLYRPPKA